MPRYDPSRSEYAIGSKWERVLYIALATLAVAGALISLLEGADARTVCVAAAVVVMASVFFVPNRRWRMAVALAAVGLMMVGFIAA